MAGIFGYSREAVRVKVKKCEGFLPPEWRKFSVDPQITSLEVLFSILAKAFDLSADFTISYRSLEPTGTEQYAAVLSDWDLDAAFLRAHNLSVASATEPCLNLRIDIKPFSEAPDWDVAAASQPSPCANSAATAAPQLAAQTPVVSSGTASASIGATGQKYVHTMQARLPGLIMNQMEKTISMVTRALNFVDDQTNLLPTARPPLSDTEFRSFLDSVGQIVQPHRLRGVIYAGGIDPSLRRVVWKHLLNVYPDGMTGRERMDYMKRKSAEYVRLRDTWRTAVQRGAAAAGPRADNELAYVTGMVRKDVLRTDRLHPFYAGTDDNQNIAALFNILTTYALNHPAVSYCQGMSDIASPLLVTMCDEAQAYICFCAVMRRLSANFMLNGVAMTLKFQHLSEALQHYDPQMAEYLRAQQADDLLFCYRWLLLEMKREFAFEDALRMLEVLWSALPPEPPREELRLAEREFVVTYAEDGSVVRAAVSALSATQHQQQQQQSQAQSQPATDAEMRQQTAPVIVRAPRETAYTKICALRRQSSAQSLLLLSTSPVSANNSAETKASGVRSLDATKRFNQSLDENVTARRRSRIACNGGSRVTTHHSLDERVRLEEDRAETVEEPLAEVSNTATTEVTTPISPPAQRQGGGHFKELKERIVAGKKATQAVTPTTDKPFAATITTKQQPMKVVRNFNEFLKLAAKPAAIVNHAETAASPTTEAITTQQQNNQRNECNSPDDSQEYFPMTTSMTRELRLELENLDRQVFGSASVNGQANKQQTNPFLCDDIMMMQASQNGTDEIGYHKLSAAPSMSLDLNDDSVASADPIDELAEISVCRSEAVRRRPARNGTDAPVDQRNSMNRCSTSSANTDVFVWENPLHCFSPSTGLVMDTAGNVVQRSPAADETIVDVGEGFIETMSEGKKSITPIRLLQSNSNGCSHTTSTNGHHPRRRHAGPTLQNHRNRHSAHYASRESSDTETEGASTSTDDEQDDHWRPSDTVRQLQQQQSDTAKAAVDSEPLSSSVEEASEASIPAAIPVAVAVPAQTVVQSEDDVTVAAAPRLNGSLPPPHEFGGGNPFLMFLCVTVLMQHRNYVMRAGMDYNEMAMHFDKMVRKHNVTRVLAQARRMYSDYMRQQQTTAGSAQRSTEAGPVSVVPPPVETSTVPAATTPLSVK